MTKNDMETKGTMPLVTVYILIYNNVAGLANALDSVLKQSYPRIELVISDDGSKDVSHEYLEEFITPYRHRFENIIIIKNETNVGTVKHINLLLKKTHGDIICGVSADDKYFNENVIEDVVKYFDNHPEKMIVTSRRMDEYDGMIRPQKSLQKVMEQDMQKYKKIMLRFLPLISGVGTYYRKELFESYGYFPEEFKLLEDASYYSKIIVEGVEFGFLDKTTYFHTKGGVSDRGSVVHPWYAQDVKYLHQIWLLNYAKEEDWFTFRCAKYRSERVYVTDKKQIIRIYIRYLDVCVYLLWMYKIRKWAA